MLLPLYAERDQRRKAMAFTDVNRINIAYRQLKISKTRHDKNYKSVIHADKKRVPDEEPTYLVK